MADLFFFGHGPFEADSIGTRDLQGQWPQFHWGVDVRVDEGFFGGQKNSQVMNAHGKISVISGT